MYNIVFDSYIKEKKPDQNLTGEEKDKNVQMIEFEEGFSPQSIK